MKQFTIFLKKVLTNKGYFPRLIFDETTNTVSIQKNKDVTIPLGGNSSETDLANYYTKDVVDDALNLKANMTDLDSKVNTLELNAELLSLGNLIGELENRIHALESAAGGG